MEIEYILLSFYYRKIISLGDSRANYFFEIDVFTLKALKPKRVKVTAVYNRQQQQQSESEAARSATGLVYKV